MSRLSRLLFPPKCPACRVLLDWYGADPAAALCPSCAKLWEIEKNETCGICGKAVVLCECVTEEMRKARCASFRKLTYYYGGRRDKVQNRVIYHIKQTRNAHVQLFLAKELLPALNELTHLCEENEPAAVTFVPRGRAAKLQHGTDQAEALARALAKQSGLPFVRLIARTRDGSTQKELSASARKHNAQSAFTLTRNADVNGKTVFLIDDIVTTGNSMAVCTRLLRKAGAKNVYCLAVASDDLNRERT